MECIYYTVLCCYHIYVIAVKCGETPTPQTFKALLYYRNNNSVSLWSKTSKTYEHSFSTIRRSRICRFCSAQDGYYYVLGFQSFAKKIVLTVCVSTWYCFSESRCVNMFYNIHNIHCSTLIAQVCFSESRCVNMFYNIHNIHCSTLIAQVCFSESRCVNMFYNIHNIHCSTLIAQVCFSESRFVKVL